MQPTNLADLSAKLAAATKGPMAYGIRVDGSTWYAIGDPINGPHQQGDINIDEPTLQALAALHNAAPAMIAELEALRADLFTAQQYATRYNSPEVQAAIYWMREKGSMHQALELWREHNQAAALRKGGE